MSEEGTVDETSCKIMRVVNEAASEVFCPYNRGRFESHALETYVRKCHAEEFDIAAELSKHVCTHLAPNFHAKVVGRHVRRGEASQQELRDRIQSEKKKRRRGRTG
eukprot:6964240-Pyramimonas_sp.AAC.1